MVYSLMVGGCSSSSAPAIGGAVVGGLGDARRASRTTSPRDEVARAERRQRRDPVDGLGHAGRLVEIQAAHPADELGRRRISGSFAPGTDAAQDLRGPLAGSGKSIQW